MTKQISGKGTAIFAILAFLLSYALSFGFQWLAAVHRLPIERATAELIASGLAVSGPALAAIVLVRGSGSSVVRWLRTDLRETRFAPWWLGVPLFTSAVAIFAFKIAGAGTAEIASLPGQLPLLLGYFAFHILVVGLLEELGWRGWLLRRLLPSRTPLAATLIVAPVWFTWHLPKLLSQGSFAAAFAAAALINSVILTALWSRYHGRTVLAAVAHGSFNAPIYFLANQFPHAHGVMALSVIVASHGLVALAVVLFDRGWWFTAQAGQGERGVASQPV